MMVIYYGHNFTKEKEKEKTIDIYLIYIHIFSIF